MSETDSNVTTQRAQDCFADTQVLGTIVQANSTLDYTASIFTRRDTEDPPGPEDCGVGQPAAVPMNVEDDTRVGIGVVYNVEIVDPGVGGLAPTLGADSGAEQFRPSMIDEPTTLTGIALLGTATCVEDSDSTTETRRITDPSHDQPRYSLGHNATVRKCPDDTFARFHEVGDDLQLAYYPRLVEVAGAFGAEVVSTIVDRLRETTDGYDDLLSVIERKCTREANVDRGVLR